MRVLRLSLDPANRVWIVGDSYRAAVEVGGPMDGFAVGEVVESNAPGFAVGDKVVISPGLSCATCAACLSGRDNLCRNYGILGENTQGGYADLRSLGHFQDEWLRGGPIRRWLPKGLEGQPMGIEIA